MNNCIFLSSAFSVRRFPSLLCAHAAPLPLRVRVSMRELVDQGRLNNRQVGRLTPPTDDGRENRFQLPGRGVWGQSKLASPPSTFVCIVVHLTSTRHPAYSRPAFFASSDNEKRHIIERPRGSLNGSERRGSTLLDWLLSTKEVAWLYILKSDLTKEHIYHYSIFSNLV